ncbi:MAG: ParB/RepB/Spo0J family partition protein [Treponema sp.]|nr:ParB/RepB/Spo0J family partition protein [Treponema sp.]
MAKKSGLGKGFDAYFPDQAQAEEYISGIVNATQKAGSTQAESEETAAPVTTTSQERASSAKPAAKAEASNLPKGISVDENGTLWVDPALLKPNPRQPRKYFDEEKLAELTESIKKEGIVETIVIQDSGDGSFEIIAGERRTRAARAAGLEKVPVQLKKYSNSQKLRVALIENIHRSDLNPVEEAQAYAEIMQTDGLTQDQVAESVGKNRSTVANSLRLLKLPNDMLNALAAGTISSGHARALLSVVNPADQKVLFDRITKQGLSVRQCEQQATELNGGNRASKKIQAPKLAEDTRDPNYIAIEQKFRDMLGTKVQMKGSFDKGSITIEYYNQADLDRIYNVIVKK